MLNGIFWVRSYYHITSTNHPRLKGQNHVNKKPKGARISAQEAREQLHDEWLKSLAFYIWK